MVVSAECCSSAPRGDILEAELTHPINPRSTGEKNDTCLVCLIYENIVIIKKNIKKFYFKK